jgi:hypothetical protein
MFLVISMHIKGGKGFEVRIIAIVMVLLYNR